MLRSLGRMLLLSCSLSPLLVEGRAAAQHPRLDALRSHVPPWLQGALQGDDFELALLDFDGDGGRDLLLDDGVLRNDGVGAFEFVPWQTPSIRRTLVGDLDGDGDADFVEGARCGINPGTGVLAWRDGCFGGDVAIALADLDGDGDLDALCRRPWQNGTVALDRATIHRNDGTGVFSEDSLALAALPLPYGVWPAIADADGDGDVDIAIQRGSMVATGGSTSLLRNDGTGRFVEDFFAVTPAIGGRYHDLEDFDRDGARDLLLVDSSFARIFWNDGRGGFHVDVAALPGLLGNPGGRPGVGDLDGDGDADIVLTNGRILWNTGARRFASGPLAFPSTGGSASVVLADLDGDADLDLFVSPKVLPSTTERAATQTALFLNDGRGGFAAADPLPLGSPSRSGYGISIDVDLDGDQDLVVANAVPLESVPVVDPPRMHLNDGTGRFVEQSSWLSLPAGVYSSVASADLDGDGAPDLIFGSTTGEFVFLRNLLFTTTPQAEPRFASMPGVLPSLGNRVNEIGLADFDRDGDPDLVAALGHSSRSTRAPNAYFRNDGGWRFADVSSQLPSGAEDTRGLAIADFDADGHLDLALANRTNAEGPLSTVELYRNDGRGGFVDVSAGVRGPQVPTNDIRFTDVNGDGRLDLVTAGTGRVGNVMLGDGRGGFFELPAAMPLSSARRLVELDVEGDGDPDYIEVQTGMLLENSGTGMFLLRWPRRFQGVQFAVASDFDGDGDRDLALLHDAYLGNGVQADYVVTNLNRQLGYRASPRIGKPQRFELHGEAGALVLLFAATARGRLSLPPLGDFHLDPSSAVLAGSASLDSSGRATISMRVPLDPTLVGRSAYWQTLGGMSARFSNLEITTFRRL